VIRQLRIEELDVGRLRVRELQIQRGDAGPEGAPAETPLGPPD
jgi:hypothetical protein